MRGSRTGLWTPSLWACVAVLWCASCSTPSGSAPSHDDAATDASASLEDVSARVVEPEPTPEAPEPGTRFARLTHLQWELTVRDLFRLDTPTGLSSTFIGDPAGTGFSTDTEHLDVPPELWGDYQRAAEDLARMVARDPELLAAIVPAVEVSNLDPCLGSFSVDVEELAPCCDGAATCVPRDQFPELLQHEMADCDDGGACIPNDIMDAMQQTGGVWTDAWSLWRTPCSYADGGEGTCMSTCFPEVSTFADLLPQDVCEDDERCIPCIDPFVGGASGACEVGWGCASFANEASLENLAIARDAFLAQFGRRAFRRPLEADELVRYAALFDQGPTILGVTDAFVAGVELTLSAMLQSPYFLYRVERSTEVGADGLVTRDGWEIATRLSYTLWNTMPPDDLLEAAEAGELETVEDVLQRAETMLEDPRTVDMVTDFHSQFMHTNDYDDIQKQPGVFEDFGDDTGAHMRTELELFVSDVIFEQGGGYADLLLSPHTFVNDELAVLYGLEGKDFGEDFERVDLDPAERSGLLTRLGFLADRAGLVHPSPISRGLLQVEQIVCVDLPPPPPSVPGLSLTSAPTNRERVELHTGEGTCGEGCHSTILNPPGFAFEHYDAIGRYRLEDNGHPVNAADVFVLDGVEVTFEDAVGWTDLLARSHQVHACYAQHWLEYLYGRAVTQADAGLIDQTATASLAGELSIKGLIGRLLATDAFLKRIPHGPGEEGTR